MDWDDIEEVDSRFRVVNRDLVEKIKEAKVKLGDLVHVEKNEVVHFTNDLYSGVQHTLQLDTFGLLVDIIIDDSPESAGGLMKKNIFLNNEWLNISSFADVQKYFIVGERLVIIEKDYTCEELIEVYEVSNEKDGGWITTVKVKDITEEFRGTIQFGSKKCVLVVKAKDKEGRVEVSILLVRSAGKAVLFKELM